jgi:hypothetical protein
MTKYTQGVTLSFSPIDNEKRDKKSSRRQSTVNSHFSTYDRILTSSERRCSVVDVDDKTGVQATLETDVSTTGGG